MTSSHGIKAKIWWDNVSGAYLVTIPYHEAFINALKTLIPSGSREYDPQTKIWYVKEEYGEFIRKLASDTFGVSYVSFTSKTVAEQAQSASSRNNPAAAKIGGGTTEDAIIVFFQLVPFEAAKKCYRETALSYHPDHNPADGDKMILLNDMWSRITKEFYKR